MMCLVKSICLLLLTFLFLSEWSVLSLEESERLRKYFLRGYSWPLPKLVPETPGWRRIMDRRFRQLEQIIDRNEKYNGWVQTMSSAIVAPNFTEYG